MGRKSNETLYIC